MNDVSLLLAGTAFREVGDVDRLARSACLIAGRNVRVTKPSHEGRRLGRSVLEQIAELHREMVTEQAQQCGLLDPDEPGWRTHPDLSRMLYADGKVVTPVFRAKPGEKQIDTTTGEVRYPRVEPDAGFHVEGTGGEGVGE